MILSPKNRYFTNVARVCKVMNEIVILYYSLALRLQSAKAGKQCNAIWSNIAMATVRVKNSLIVIISNLDSQIATFNE